MVSADSQKAVEAIARLEKETKSVSAALKAIADEGKNVNETFEDLSKYSGSGSHLDNVTSGSKELTDILSSLSDINWSGALEKMKKAYEVGRFIGDAIGAWEWGVDQFNEKLKASQTAISAAYGKIEEAAVGRASGMDLSQIQSEIDGYSNSIARLTRQQKELNEESFRFELAADKEAVATSISQQERLRDALKEVYEERAKQPPRTQSENEKVAAQFVHMTLEQAQAFREAEYEAGLYIDSQAKLQAEQDRLQQSQASYIAGLELELVKLKEGEEAYDRKRLAMLDYSDETIEKALKMKAEINELNELNKIRAEEATRLEREGRDTPIRIGQRGELRGDSQRFITRGIGMKGDEKLLAAAKEQAQRSKDLLAESRKQTALLAKLPKGVTE